MEMEDLVVVSLVIAGSALGSYVRFDVVIFKWSCTISDGTPRTRIDCWVCFE